MCNRKIKFYRNKEESRLTRQINNELRELKEKELREINTITMLNSIASDNNYITFNDLFIGRS
jgi:hypothetical protein